MGVTNALAKFFGGIGKTLLSGTGQVNGFLQATQAATQDHSQSSYSPGSANSANKTVSAQEVFNSNAFGGLHALYAQMPEGPEKQQFLDQFASLTMTNAPFCDALRKSDLLVSGQVADPIATANSILSQLKAGRPVTNQNTSVPAYLVQTQSLNP